MLDKESRLGLTYDDVVLVPENPACRSPDHRTVPPHQHLERGGGPVIGVSTHQFSIGQRVSRRDPADLRGQQRRFDSRHAPVPVGPPVKTSVPVIPSLHFLQFLPRVSDSFRSFLRPAARDGHFDGF